MRLESVASLPVRPGESAQEAGIDARRTQATARIRRSLRPEDCKGVCGCVHVYVCVGEEREVSSGISPGSRQFSPSSVPPIYILLQDSKHYTQHGTTHRYTVGGVEVVAAQEQVDVIV